LIRRWVFDGINAGIIDESSQSLADALLRALIGAVVALAALAAVPAEALAASASPVASAAPRALYLLVRTV